MSVWRKTNLIKELSLDGQRGLINNVYPIEGYGNVEYELKDNNNIQRTCFRIELSNLTKENLLGIIRLNNPFSNEYDVNNVRMTFTHNTSIETINLDIKFQCGNIELEIYNKNEDCYEVFSMSPQTEMKLVCDMDEWFENNYGVNTMNMLKMAVYTPEQYADHFKLNNIIKHTEEANCKYTVAFNSLDDVQTQNTNNAEIKKKCDDARTILSDKATNEIEVAVSQIKILANDNAFNKPREVLDNVPKETFDKVEDNKKSAFKDKLKSAVSGIVNFAINVMERSNSTKNIEKVINAISIVPIPDIPNLLKNLKVKKIQKEIIMVNNYQYTLDENSHIIKTVAKNISDRTNYEGIKKDCDEVIRASNHLENQDNVGRFCRTVDNFITHAENSKEINYNEKNSVQGGINRIKMAVRSIEQSLSSETKSQLFFEGKTFDNVNQSLRNDSKEIALNGIKMPFISKPKVDKQLKIDKSQTKHCVPELA